MNIEEYYFNNNFDENKIGTAYQFKIREEKKKKESKKPYWNNLDLDLKNAIVRKTDRTVAKKIIEEYEWLGCLAAINFHYFGIFFKDKKTNEEVCGGVVIFGQEYAENLGVWDKYGFTGKIILLNRGVCLHWTPKNSASKLITNSIKMLPEKYEIITATVDHMAGEIGTIYQSCNFYYVGSMRESNAKVKSRNRDRFGVFIDGKLFGSRAIRAKIGSQKKSEILKHYPDAKFVLQKSKHRYFLFRGSKKIKKQHKKNIQHLIKDYPKR